MRSQQKFDWRLDKCINKQEILKAVDKLFFFSNKLVRDSYYLWDDLAVDPFEISGVEESLLRQSIFDGTMLHVAERLLRMLRRVGKERYKTTDFFAHFKHSLSLNWFIIRSQFQPTSH